MIAPARKCLVSTSKNNENMFTWLSAFSLVMDFYLGTYLFANFDVFSASLLIARLLTGVLAMDSTSLPSFLCSSRNCSRLSFFFILGEGVGVMFESNNLIFGIFFSDSALNFAKVSVFV